MKVAAVQMTSGTDVARNGLRRSVSCAEAADAGAGLAVPENSRR
jgi:hypothetical protein